MRERLHIGISHQMTDERRQSSSMLLEKRKSDTLSKKVFLSISLATKLRVSFLNTFTTLTVPFTISTLYWTFGAAFNSLYQP